MKDTKIEAKTFGILPIAYIDHEPPSGTCGAPPKHQDLSDIEKKWVEKVNNSLSKKFPEQTFTFFSKEQLESASIDIIMLYEKASRTAENIGLMQIPQTQSNKLKYVERTQNADLIHKLSNLNPEQELDYFIVLSNPKLKGTIETTYTASPTGGGYASTQTRYASDVVVTVWDAKTSDLVYATGALASSTGFCFFVSPIEGSINGSSMQISTRLKDVIAKILQKKDRDIAFK